MIVTSSDEDAFLDCCQIQIFFTSQTKEFYIFSRMHRHPVTNSASIDSRQQRTEHLRGVALLRRVSLLAERHRAVTKHFCPLGDGIVVVRRCDRCVNIAVVELNPRSSAAVAWVGIVNPLGPPLR